MPPEKISDDEAARRREDAAQMVGDVVDWLHQEAIARMLHRSYGKQRLVIVWEDGKLTRVLVGNTNTIKPRGKTKFPGRQNVDVGKRLA